MTPTEKLIIIMEHRDSLVMTTGSELLAMGISIVLMSFLCKD